VKSTLILMALFVALLASPASATILDLTAAGTCPTPTNTAGCSINGAYYNQTTEQSTGTGVIEPFVRIQANTNESGINTDGPYTLDEKTGTWTHSTLVSDFGAITPFAGSSTQYVRFLLDINENSGSSNELLVLNQLKIYTSATANLNTVALLGSSATLRYNLDAGTDSSVLLNYDLNSGSGSGDLTVYVPASLFAGTGSQYLYLYSQFGCITNVTTCAGQGTFSAGYDSSDGFEEWAKIKEDGGGLGGGNPVPEPSQFLSLFVVGIPVVIGYIRKRRAAQVV